MIRALRRRLTGLYALFSALVLAAALAVSGSLEARALCRADGESLLAALEALAARANSGTLADSWLAEREQTYTCQFYLEDNGVPLAYTRQNGTGALVTGELLARCAALPAGQTERFTFTAPDGKQYRCAALALVPANLRQPVRPLLALRSTAPLRRQLAGVAVKYSLLWVGGAALLTLAGALLARIALRPTGEALRRQNEFVAAASHELRSPLAVIKSSLQAAAEEPRQQDRLLAIARAETDRMQRLAEELLFLAGQDAGGLTLHPESLEPDTLLLECWEAWQAPARQSGHPLRLDLPEEPLPTLWADRQRLEQLLGILLHNALDHTPAGSAVELAARREGKGVKFLVRDHGPGVPDRDKGRIFRRFARGETSRTGKEHFGLGLSIARQIALLHKGKLWVEDAPGGGAVFFLELPTGWRLSSVPPDEERQPPPPPGRQPRG